MKVILRELKKEEIAEALQLTWEVFEQFEAPDYTKEGMDEFDKSIHDPKWLAIYSDGKEVDTNEIIYYASWRDIME